MPAEEPVGEDVEQGAARRRSRRSRGRSSSEPATALAELMGRRLDDVRLAVMMLDGLELKGRTMSSRSGSRPRA